MPYTPITVSRWRKAVQKKRGSTACGPDGVSKQDLTCLTDEMTQSLIDMFHHIEQGAEWPQAMLTGLITAIEKHPHAHSPSDFRPICVLSLAYRTWASIRTKEILGWLSKFSPEGLIGNRSRKETAHIWWSVASMIEQTWYDDHEVHGCITGIVKCYNCLPRIPVFAIATKMRLPIRILHPWLRVITCLERRFVITGGTGPGLRSTTGFPEGDPLSVAAMYLINLVMFQWVKFMTPSVRLWTFVDNIETTATNPGDALDSLDALKPFCSSLDIELDTAKTVCWATSSEAREYMRMSGCTVIYDTKDLGGQMVFCRRHTNKVVRARAEGLGEYWTRLARSPAPLEQKELSLRVAAWPRALHGISTAIFGQDHLTRLRTRALRSLGWTNKGMHPMLQLSCLSDIRSDPGYWCLWQTVIAFRRFADPLPCFQILDFLIDHPEKRIDPGPCGVLLQRLHHIAWSWHSGGWLTDHQGFQIHLMDSPIQLLKQRLQHGWRAMVGAIAAERKSMRGLATADFGFTLEAFQRYDTKQKGFLRYALNGSFFTKDKLIHAGLVQILDAFGVMKRTQ